MKKKIIQNIAKYRYIFISILSVVLLMAIIMGIRSYRNAQPMLTLKKNVFEVEYGQLVSRNLLNYVNINEYKEKKKGPPLKKTTCNLNIPLDENKYCSQIGEYNITIQYDKEKELSFKIIVKDTTAPEIISYFKNDTECYEGEKVDFEGMFDSRDLSDSQIEIDDREINYEKSGNYTLKVTVTDEYQNKKDKEYTVKVKNKEFNLRLHELKVQETASTKFNPEIKGKAEDVSYSSSNEDVVSVDLNGRIRAKKEGKAIITASMGELTDKCTVTVLENRYYKK